MVTKVSAYERPITVFGLSTDAKPVDVLNGSMFIESDTSSIYFFDQEGAAWLQWGGSSPSGGNTVGTALVGTAIAG